MQKTSILMFLLTPVLSTLYVSAVAAHAERPESPEYKAHFNSAAQPRSAALLKTAMLERHNIARNAVAAPPLIWDAQLVKSAQKYANILAASGQFEHDPANIGPDSQGENLWMGTRGAFSYVEMVNAWIDERRYFKKGPFPDNSNTGNWGDVGHYTQIIWPTTTKLGCALASNQGNDVLVCRYAPGGNIIGRDPLKG